MVGTLLTDHRHSKKRDTDPQGGRNRYKGDTNNEKWKAGTMNNYIVFLGRRGANSIVWRAEENPLGVFSGETAQDAMQQAAAYHGVMGAFFAVQGEFWGVTPQNVPKPFGERDTVDEKISKLIDVYESKLELDKGTPGEGGAEIPADTVE